MTTGRQDHGCGLVTLASSPSPVVIVAGGENANTVEILDLSSSPSWQTIATLPSSILATYKLSRLSPVGLEGEIAIIQNAVRPQTLYLLHPTTLEWREWEVAGMGAGHVLEAVDAQFFPQCRRGL